MKDMRKEGMKDRQLRCTFGPRSTVYGKANLSVMHREACYSIVVKAICYKPEGCRFETRCGEIIFSIYLILPAALSPGVHSASTEMSTRSKK
jgi:hypothetical protein